VNEPYHVCIAARDHDPSAQFLRCEFLVGMRRNQDVRSLPRILVKPIHRAAQLLDGRNIELANGRGWCIIALRSAPKKAEANSYQRALFHFAPACAQTRNPELYSAQRWLNTIPDT
jgi:hypothetical protein